MIDKKSIEEHVRGILAAFGEDPEREGLKDTPRRVAGYWEELLEGSQYTNQQIADMYGKRFNVPSCPLVVKQVKTCSHTVSITSH